MSECCRLCLFESDNCVNLLSTTESNNKLLQKILKYLHFEIKLDDIHSKNVCQNCIACIEEFDVYFSKVSANQHLLQIVSTSPMPSDTMSIPIYITSPKISEILHVTHYSIKTENGIFTLQPATTTSSSDETPLLSTTQPTSINFSNINDNENVETDIGSIIDLKLHNDPATDDNTIVITQIDTDCSEKPVDKYTINEINNEMIIRNDNSQEIDLAASKLSSSNERNQSKLTSIKHKKCKRQTVQITNSTTKDLVIVPVKNDSKIINVNIDDDDDDDNDEIIDGYYSDIDILSEKSSSETFDNAVNNDDDEDDDLENDIEIIFDNCNEKFKGFPKVMIKNSKLIYRGKILLSLMSKFYRLECNLCLENDAANKSSFECLTKLFTHYADIHSIKGYVICCGTKLFKPKAIALHMSRHLQPSAFQCKICEKMMTCPKILQYHIQNHKPENERPLACPDCPRKFSYSSALIAHSISHLPESERVAHICDECGKSFLSPGRLSTHINVAHVNRGQDFICHICAKQFSCRSNLVYHLTTHQPRIHQVQCLQCNKWLKNKLCLRKHMVQHSEIRYKCDSCDYSALNRQCLKNHKKVQHSDIKPFSCEHCGKTFKLRNTLINHQVQHTGIKKFTCEFCDRTFASSGNYYSHRKRMHKDELAAVNKKKEEEDRLLRQKCIKNEPE